MVKKEQSDATFGVYGDLESLPHRDNIKTRGTIVTRNLASTHQQLRLAEMSVEEGYDHKIHTIIARLPEKLYKKGSIFLFPPSGNYLDNPNVIPPYLIPIPPDIADGLPVITFIASDDDLVDEEHHRETEIRLHRRFHILLNTEGRLPLYITTRSADSSKIATSSDDRKKQGYLISNNEIILDRSANLTLQIGEFPTIAALSYKQLPNGTPTVQIGINVNNYLQMIEELSR